MSKKDVRFEAQTYTDRGPAIIFYNGYNSRFKNFFHSNSINLSLN